MRLFTAFIFQFLGLIVFTQEHRNDVPSYRNELIEYNLELGFVNIGTAKIETIKDPEGRGDYIVANAQSVGFVKFLKDIQYRFECCMDTLTGLPLEDSRKIIEVDHASISMVSYDHISDKDSTLIYNEETGEVAIPKNTYDILTGFFNYRHNYLWEDKVVGQVDTITTFFFEDIWDLIIKYGGVETIKLGERKVECIKLMPETQVGRYFKTKEGMSVWVTKDKRHIPMKMNVNMRIGSLNAEIINYEAYDQ